MPLFGIYAIVISSHTRQNAPRTRSPEFESPPNLWGVSAVKHTVIAKVKCLEPLFGAELKAVDKLKPRRAARRNHR
jgi:hypothetical protein